MNTKGIRILDKEDNHVSVELKDILAEIDGGGKFYWSILFFGGLGNLEKRHMTIPEFMKNVNESKNGLNLTWEDLNQLASLFWEIIDIVIIGSKDAVNLHRYEDDEAMYQSCDIVIVKFDSSYWEVFSINAGLIDTLSKKFMKIKPLKPDFQNENGTID